MQIWTFRLIKRVLKNLNTEKKEVQFDIWRILPLTGSDGLETKELRKQNHEIL